jgi:hydrogenase maturation protease
MLTGGGPACGIVATHLPYFWEGFLKTLVVGLGNPILTDDGVGVHTVRAVAERYVRDDVAFAEASVGGLRLLDVVTGYERVIVVDAIQTPGGRPGNLYCLCPGDLRASLHSGSTHDLSLPGALALGRCLGLSLPDDGAITIVAVEVKDVTTFGETCTPQVQATVPRAAQMVLQILSEQT